MDLSSRNDALRIRVPSLWSHFDYPTNVRVKCRREISVKNSVSKKRVILSLSLVVKKASVVGLLAEWKVRRCGDHHIRCGSQQETPHEWPWSSRPRWQVRYGTGDSERVEWVKSSLGDLIKGFPYPPVVETRTPSKLQLVDSYELPKVRYAVLSLVTSPPPPQPSLLE